MLFLDNVKDEICLNSQKEEEMKKVQESRSNKIME